MDWLKKTEYRRKSPINLWPEAKSAIVLGLNYGPRNNPLLKNKKNDLGNISVYANGEDYHTVFKGKLKRFASKLFSILNKDKLLDLVNAFLIKYCTFYLCQVFNCYIYYIYNSNRQQQNRPGYSTSYTRYSNSDSY